MINKLSNMTDLKDAQSLKKRLFEDRLARELAESIKNGIQHYSVKEGYNGRTPDTVNYHDFRESIPSIIADAFGSDSHVSGMRIRTPNHALKGNNYTGVLSRDHRKLTFEPAPGYNRPTYTYDIYSGELEKVKDAPRAGDNLLDIDPDEAGPRLRAINKALNHASYISENEVQEQPDKDIRKILEAPEGKLELRGGYAYDKADKVIEDLKPELADSLADKLKARIPSYLLWGGGGALLGRLIAGKKRRLLGYGIGAATGVLANYLRRKSYYGGLVGW